MPVMGNFSSFIMQVSHSRLLKNFCDAAKMAINHPQEDFDFALNQV
jgi:hypothetical protein